MRSSPLLCPPARYIPSTAREFTVTHIRAKCPRCRHGQLLDYHTNKPEIEVCEYTPDQRFDCSHCDHESLLPEEAFK